MWAAVRDGLAESAGRSEIRPIVDAQRDLGPSDGEATTQLAHRDPGFKGTPTLTRVIPCNGVGDYELGRYAIYQSDGT